jgi:hypothetical protein
VLGLLGQFLMSSNRNASLSDAILPLGCGVWGGVGWGGCGVGDSGQAAGPWRALVCEANLSSFLKIPELQPEGRGGGGVGGLFRVSRSGVPANRCASSAKVQETCYFLQFKHRLKDIDRPIATLDLIAQPRHGYKRQQAIAKHCE